MPALAHNSVSVCPLRSCNRSSSARRVGSASARNTPSIPLCTARQYAGNYLHVNGNVGGGADTAAVAYDEDLAERIRERVAGEDGLTEKRMFGGLAFLINGNMAVSASGQGGMLLRVDPAQTEE